MLCAGPDAWRELCAFRWRCAGDNGRKDMGLVRAAPTGRMLALVLLICSLENHLIYRRTPRAVFALQPILARESQPEWNGTHLALLTPDFRASVHVCDKRNGRCVESTVVHRFAFAPDPALLTEQPV